MNFTASLGVMYNRGARFACRGRLYAVRPRPRGAHAGRRTRCARVRDAFRALRRDDPASPGAHRGQRGSGPGCAAGDVPARLDARGSFAGWLYRIATNLAFNHLRSVRRRREQPLEIQDDEGETESEDDRNLLPS